MKIQYDIEARRQIGEIFKYGKVKFGIQIALKYKEKLMKEKLTCNPSHKRFLYKFS